MLKYLSSITLLFVLACEPPADVEDIIQADKQFSEMSAKEGVSKAFVAFADSQVVILRDKRPPLKGLVAVTKAYDFDDSNLQLTWAPEKAEIADSGELGYSYGSYEMVTTDSTGTTTTTGNYVSIWKKQPDGAWKYVLDTGTQDQ